METIDHRAIAIHLFNHCWELLEKDDRSADEDVALITSAFTSRYHWSQEGDPDRLITADWMISRAAAAIADGDLAVRFALLAYERSQTSETPDWLAASVAEGLARAYAAAGDTTERDNWCSVAEGLIGAISDAEDRKLIESQLQSVPR